MGCENIYESDKYKTVNECSSNGPIIERFEDLYIGRKEFEEIIHFSDVRKGDIYINLIHYDKNMKKNENFEYYRYFSIKIIGDYSSFDDFNMLKLFLSKTKQIPIPPSYILMTSGSESIDILKEFYDVPFITDIIIFCYEVDKYLYLKSNYEKIKLISNNFYEIRNFLLKQKFSDRDLNMDNHLLKTPLITYYNYKKGLFPIHRILCNFFDKRFITFSDYDFEIAKIFIKNSTFEQEVKNKIIEIMKKLRNIESGIC